MWNSFQLFNSSMALMALKQVNGVFKSTFYLTFYYWITLKLTWEALIYLQINRVYNQLGKVQH